jgi:glutamyl-Q tRNA(Asp) synthetase
MTYTPPSKYVGRFAPSPTGPVHLGTLVAAMASYLQARQQQGQWLLRIEDLDPPREIPGSADTIIRTLETLGFEWDQSILYQSTRSEAYLDTVTQLLHQQHAYACNCSRKTIADSQDGKTSELTYSGFCRNRKLPVKGEVAIRVITQPNPITYADQIAGKISQNLLKQSGDFVVKRKDGLIAYQLAVVIDDAYQEVTDIVRGADLLDSTPRQIHLQNILKLSTPGYAHIPLLLDSQGKKFSKSSYLGKPPENDLNSLLKSWHHLNQIKVDAKDFDHIQDFWRWAIKNWDINLIKQND